MAGAKGVLAAGVLAALAAGCVSSGGSKPAATVTATPPAEAAVSPAGTAPGGLPPPPPGSVVLRPGVFVRPDGILVTRINENEYRRRLQTGYSDQEIGSLVRNKTVLFAGSGLSNRVEYLAGDGRAYLWLINTTASAQTNWTIDANKTICVAYPLYPSNLKRLGKPQCSSIATWDKDIIGRVDGDIFGLSSGQVPKSMPGFPYELQKLRQDLGLAAGTPAATPPLR